jgi:predicted ATPase
LKIKRVRIRNYKGFLDSGDVYLGDGFNFVVGRNDSGKSALLESLTLRAGSKPHRTSVTLPDRSSATEPWSTFEARVQVHRQDIEHAVGSILNLYLRLPYKYKRSDSDDYAFRALANGFEFKKTFCAEQNQTAFFAERTDVWPQSSAVEGDFYIRIDRVGPREAWLAKEWHVGSGEDLLEICAQRAQNAVYMFRAERLGLATHPASGNATLSPDARNLSEVLNTLISSNPHRFQQLVEKLRLVFPHIQAITAPSLNNVAEIKVWHERPATQRDDLAVSLAESGTGIGQVLALLYQVMQTEVPSVICIDEPQSFLHPGAFRKLMEILRGYPMHQYIISTHAPIHTNAAAGDRVLMVRRGEKGSTVEAIPTDQQSSLRDVLAELGVRLSDVFGADGVVWVEGKTEEHCFPELLRGFAPTALLGVQVLGVASTSDLTSKRAEKIVEIYTKLTVSSALLPPSLSFVLDAEDYKVDKRRELERRFGGRLHWLPRRMYECYLLDSGAIAERLCALDSDVAHSKEEVAGWLNSQGAEAAFQGNGGALSAEWLRTVDAAKLLGALWTSLTNSRHEYKKVSDGIELTRILIARGDKPLQELALQLAEWIQGGKLDGVLG